MSVQSCCKDDIIIRNQVTDDDNVLVAFSERDLQEIVRKVNESSQMKAGLSINNHKTKLLVVFRNPGLNHNITIGGKKLEREQQFKCLGAYVNEACDSYQEIKTWLEFARASINTMRKVLVCRQLKLGYFCATSGS